MLRVHCAERADPLGAPAEVQPEPLASPHAWRLWESILATEQTRAR